jgi:hypothetical protein
VNTGRKRILSIVVIIVVCVAGVLLVTRSAANNDSIAAAEPEGAGAGGTSLVSNIAEVKEVLSDSEVLLRIRPEGYTVREKPDMLIDNEIVKAVIQKDDSEMMAQVKILKPGDIIWIGRLDTSINFDTDPIEIQCYRFESFDEYANTSDSASDKCDDEIYNSNVEPIEITKGLSVMPGAKDKLSQREIDDFIDEYGTDSNIIVYEVSKGG